MVHRTAILNHSIVMRTLQQQNIIYTPYCYFIGWSKENKFYYGSRTAKTSKCLYETGCHPDDFWVTYFTSSKYVDRMRKKYGEPDIREVRKTFTTGEAAKVYESRVIARIRAVERKEWLNEGNPGGSYIMSEEVRQKISKSSIGKSQSERAKQVASKTHKGKKLANYHKNAIISSITGKNNHQYQPFTLHVKLPCGKEETHRFEGLLECYNSVGIQGTRIKWMKDGNIWTIQHVTKNARHNWPRLTKCWIILSQYTQQLIT